LISNEHKFVKIYHNEDKKIQPSLQNFFNFLPDAKKDERDRCMPIQNLRMCMKHNRLLMQFNYPGSCKPKEVLVIPYISDNLISMNSRNNKDSFTWLANKRLSQDFMEKNEEDEAETGPDANSVTRMF